MAKVQTKILNYRVIIEREHYPDRTAVYTASVPTLGVFDYGPTVDAVLKSIKDGIELAVDCLVEEGEEVPVDQTEEAIITYAQIPRPKKVKAITP